MVTTTKEFLVLPQRGQLELPVLLMPGQRALRLDQVCFQIMSHASIHN